KVTPNHHKLAREFVLLDNFYVNADVSADGFYWTTAAIAPDTNQKTWPMSYARRVYARGSRNPEGTRQAPGGHIWDKAAEAGSLSITTASPPATCLTHPIPAFRSPMSKIPSSNRTPITTSASTIAPFPISIASRSSFTTSPNGKRTAACRNSSL
ncbi:MAG: hypothetical protein JO099_13635, partial [Acidobacteriia bacterium]|nr:hypothetical protein [Terriglobia bacterium]